MRGSVTFSIAPPGKLTGWRFTTLIDYIAHCARKAFILNPVKHDGTNCEHALMTFASCFPVHRERNTTLRLSVYLTNALDGLLDDVIAFTRPTTGGKNRSTANQQCR